MSTLESIKRGLHDHCLGTGDPAPSLERTGTLTRSWVESYLRLLEEASVAWGDDPLWPREVVAAVGTACFRLRSRYEQWHLWTTGVNSETEHLLAQVEAPSERFLMTGKPGTPRSIAGGRNA